MSINNTTKQTKHWNKVPRALSLLNIVCKRDNQLILSFLQNNPAATIDKIEEFTGLAKRSISVRIRELQQIGLIISKEQQQEKKKYYLNKHLYLKIHLASLAFA